MAFVDPTVDKLREGQLDAADRVFRLAFGTFLRLPDPLTFAGDADYVRTRWRAAPEAAFGAERAGELVGSNFVTQWGSFGYFGPLSVHPHLWDRGVAKHLLAATMDLFERWNLRHAGLFTFAESTKHVALYQRFGFAPRFLTAIMAKAVSGRSGQSDAARYSALPAPAQAAAVRACRALADGIFDGLDLSREIRAVEAQSLGDTVLLMEDGEPRGFGVCHWGAGTEAGSGTCYVKFGAVRHGPAAATDFERLLAACEDVANGAGMRRLVAGVNTAREGAYARLRACGFRTEIQGVAMQRPNEPGYNRPDTYVIDDWR
jgi:GNAT superfamily N-acetyltransferase